MVKKKIHVVNDLHGNEDLLEELFKEDLKAGDVIVINGDLGGRGPITAEIVKIYYEVRRGETTRVKLDAVVCEAIDRKIALEDWLVFSSIHSGTFQKYLADRYEEFLKLIEKELEESLEILQKIHDKYPKCEIILVPGNGEITVLDFDVSNGIDKEVSLSPLERYFNQLALRGVIWEKGAYYANYPMLIDDETLSIPIDYVDLWIAGEARTDFDFSKVRRVITHYPPYSRVILSEMNHKENSLGLARMKAVSEILSTCPNLKYVVFGHIHRGTTKEELAKFRPSLEFPLGKYLAIWNRPGHVFRMDF